MRMLKYIGAAVRCSPCSRSWSPTCLLRGSLPQLEGDVRA